MDSKRIGDLVDMKVRVYMQAHDGCNYQQAFHEVLNGEPKLKEAYADTPVTSVKSSQIAATKPIGSLGWGRG